MSKVNKATKLKELKLKHPEVKAWVYEHDIWSPTRMPDNTWSDNTTSERTDYYYLVQRLASEVGVMQIFNKEKHRYSTICYIREQLNDMGRLVPSISSTTMYANDLVAPAPAKASKNSNKIGYAQIYNTEIKTLTRALVNNKAFAKR
jgi:hypothetical protein